MVEGQDHITVNLLLNEVNKKNFTKSKKFKVTNKSIDSNDKRAISTDTTLMYSVLTKKIKPVFPIPIQSSQTISKL